MADHEMESIVVMPLPPRYRLKDLLLGEQHSEDDRLVLLRRMLLTTAKHPRPRR